MTRKSSPDLPTLVDAFVHKINSGPRAIEQIDDVPEFLREPALDEDVLSYASDDWTSWRIVRRDNGVRIDELQQRIGKVFPPSFQYFLANYSFPAFECGSLMVFANTGEHTTWELGTRLVADPHMSPHLLKAGYLQIGNPFFYNYDPVCFDCNGPRIEKRIVQLDHEAILCYGKMTVLKEIAPSFVDFVRAALG